MTKVSEQELASTAQKLGVSVEDMQRVSDKFFVEGKALFTSLGFDSERITPAKLEAMTLIPPKNSFVLTEELLQKTIAAAIAHGYAMHMHDFLKQAH